MKKTEIKSFTVKKKKLPILDLELVEAIHLKTKFQINYLRRPNFQENYFSFFIPFGSNNLSLPSLEKLPKGTSHYLEHCIFKPDFQNKMEKLGIYTNAYTSNDHTLHYGRGTKNIISGILLYLEELLIAKITEERVEDERAIILAELGLYEDDFDIIAYQKVLEELYFPHPICNDILGDKKSINEIRARHLNEVLENAYQPQKMTLTIVGQLDFISLLNLLDEVLVKSKANTKPYKKDLPAEIPAKILKKAKNIELQQARSELALYFALRDYKHEELYQKYQEGQVTNLELAKHHYRMQVFFELLFGDSSAFFNQIVSEYDLADNFNFQYISYGEHAYFVLNVSTKKAQDFLNMLEEFFASDSWQAYLLNKELEIVSKSHLGILLQSCDTLLGLASFLENTLSYKLDVQEYIKSLINENIDPKGYVDYLNFRSPFGKNGKKEAPSKITGELPCVKLLIKLARKTPCFSYGECQQENLEKRGE